MRESRCRHCKQPLVWATNSTSGKPMPLDPSPDSGLGSFERWVAENSDGERISYARRLTGEALHAAIANGQLLWIDHRDSCNAFRPHNPRPPHVTLTLRNSRSAARKIR